VPDNDDCPTGVELVRDLLQPIAGLADIAPRIRYGTRVLEIARDGLLKSDEIGTAQRSEPPFRILIEQAGDERIVFADVVLDCTGTYHNPNALGRRGIRAPGERSVADSIVRHLPDVAADKAGWAGQRVLLVGEGHSGQTAARALSKLCSRHPDTAVA
jgi:cation diffusion facilitator CzcD-associated flavoprotein CzcO